MKYFFLLLLLIPAAAKSQTPAAIKYFSYTVDKKGKASDTVVNLIRRYNKLNKLIQEERYWTDSKGKEIKIITYDSLDQIAKIALIFKDSSFIAGTTYERDLKGNILSETSAEDGEKIVIKHQNIFDKNGLLIKTILTPDDSAVIMESPKYSSEFTYDNNKNLLTIRSFANLKLIDYTSYEYDQKNNRISEFSVDTRIKQNEKYIYAYDEMNRKIKQQYFRNSKLISITEYTWNSNAITTEISTTMADGSKTYIYQ